MLSNEAVKGHGIDPSQVWTFMRLHCTCYLNNERDKLSREMDVGGKGAHWFTVTSRICHQVGGLTRPN